MHLNRMKVVADGACYIKGLERYVWAKAGKVLRPFERVELEEAMHDAKERVAAWPGRADAAWRVHGKASWAGECLDERHAEYGQKGLAMGTKTEAARRRAAGVLGNKDERAWVECGKVVEQRRGQTAEGRRGGDGEKMWVDGGKVMDAVCDSLDPPEVGMVAKIRAPGGVHTRQAIHDSGSKGGETKEGAANAGERAGGSLLERMAALGGGDGGHAPRHMKDIRPRERLKELPVHDAQSSWRPWHDAKPIQNQRYASELKERNVPEAFVRTGMGLTSARRNGATARGGGKGSASVAGKA